MSDSAQSPVEFEKAINSLMESGRSLRTIASDINEDVSLISRILSGTRPLSYRVARKLAGRYDLASDVRLAMYREITVFTDLTPEERESLGAHLAEIASTN